VTLPQGGLLIPARGKSLTLHEHQIRAYSIRPRSGISLLSSVDSTVFVSDLPELRGYEFLCTPIRDDRNPYKVRYTYILTRVDPNQILIASLEGVRS
jgi:hypothetical protein